MVRRTHFPLKTTGVDTEFEKSTNQSQPPQEPVVNQISDVPKFDVYVQLSKLTHNKLNTRQQWRKKECVDVIISQYATQL